MTLRELSTLLGLLGWESSSTMSRLAEPIEETWYFYHCSGAGMIAVEWVYQEALWLPRPGGQPFLPGYNVYDAIERALGNKQ
jgi:hypothetical protein